jgi:hypothetical protein
MSVYVSAYATAVYHHSMEEARERFRLTCERLKETVNKEQCELFRQHLDATRHLIRELNEVSRWEMSRLERALELAYEKIDKLQDERWED